MEEQRQDTLTTTISLGLNVLSTAYESLGKMVRILQTEPNHREQFAASVNAILDTTRSQRKVVMTGVGKSGYIGQKLVATFQSFGVDSRFLHPTEALHGDMGSLKEGDLIIMISHSGRTPELEKFIQYVNPVISVILISSTQEPKLAAILDRPFFLLQTYGNDEKAAGSGVPAPTTSTLAALVMGDALAVTCGHHLHGSTFSTVFHRNHPGGAIGLDAGLTDSDLSIYQHKSKL